jgi:hypothetical protein
LLAPPPMLSRLWSPPAVVGYGGGGVKFFCSCNGCGDLEGNTVGERLPPPPLLIVAVVVDDECELSEFRPGEMDMPGRMLDCCIMVSALALLSLSCVVVDALEACDEDDWADGVLLLYFCWIEVA